MSEWQPIETAPTAQSILIWCIGTKFDDEGFKIGRLEYFGVGGRRVPVISATIYSTFPEAYTHWQPLPSPPEKS